MALLAAGSAVPSALVALTVFRASAWACLLCFTSYNERLQICQIFVGLESPDLEKCEEALTDAFKGLQDTEISEETPHILQGPEGGMWKEGPERPGETEGNKGSETGGWRLCGGQRLRDGRTEALRGPEAQRREDRGFAGARGSETGGQRLCGGQRLRDGRTEALRRPEAQREAEEGPLWGCGVGEPLHPSSCLRPPDYEERSHLHDAFTQMTHSLQEVAAAQGSFQVAFPHAAEKMQKIILQLKEVQACIRPCGLQEVARRFRCRGCYSTVCDLPLDCPAPDSGPVLLPRDTKGPRIPGSDPAGAAHAPRHLLLRDHTRPAAPGAALLLSERCGRGGAARQGRGYVRGGARARLT
ncbi:sperm acrosome membrane-associated protein 6 isoform X4 [Globicephala melas]|uniref:sperm acrosome membrane-associated protein 6 isoform X4 n=1 Tax=Globicephala melas TaxID=9731 RepID=UPI00293D452C|nr:sperm acrosome membrane-associated protein 6 isoform X4 [Globicephala melas]